MNPFFGSPYSREDINTISARSVYPTAPGGTSSAAAGAMTGYTNGVGVSSDGEPGSTVVPASPRGRSVMWWLGILVLLAGLIFAARKAGSAEDFRNLSPTFYNFATVTFTAVLGIYALKVIFARWRIPGASDLILSV